MIMGTVTTTIIIITIIIISTLITALITACAKLRGLWHKGERWLNTLYSLSSL
jgi:hypothetical protein